MRTRSLVWAAMIISVSALFSAGCGSSDESVKQKAFPDEAAYCAGRAKAFCSETFVANCSISKDKCVVSMQAQCGPTDGTYRPDAAETCINTIKGAYADTELTAIEQAKIDRDCGKVFDGPGEVGEACSSGIDCDLDLGLECVRGKCEKPREVKGGEMCEEPDAVCAAGYYCEPSANGCLVQPGEGKACNEVKTCADGFYCAKAAPTDADGICSAQLADGEDCTSSSQCASKLCIVTKLGPKGEEEAHRCGPKSVFATGTPICERANLN